MKPPPKKDGAARQGNAANLHEDPRQRIQEPDTAGGFVQAISSQEGGQA